MNMSDSAGFNIEDLINVPPLKEDGDMRDIKVDQMMGKLRRLQQGKRVLEEEIKEIKSVSDSLQKELATCKRVLEEEIKEIKSVSDSLQKELATCKRVLEEEIKEIKSVSDSLQKELATLQNEAYQLEGIHKEKEEFCRKLQFQCEESEQDSARLLKQSKKNDELLEQYRCEIQEFKLKHRKQRMKFENQLHQLIEQHRNLHSVFTPEMLPDEIGSAENIKSQLLSAEQMKLAQLQHLNEELEEVKKQNQLRITQAETQEE